MRYLLIFTVLLWCAINYTAGSSPPYYYMDELCNKTIDLTTLHAIRLKLSRGVFYKANLNCALRITSMMFSDRFMVFFRHFDVEASISCTRDWLEVRDGASPSSSYVSAFRGRKCGSYITSSVGTTTGSELFLGFYSDESYQQTGFDMIITQYHTGDCYSYEFSCANGRCIDENLVCNLQNPCGDYSDCADVLAAGAIAAIVIGSILFAVCIVSVAICFRRRRYRQPYGTIGAQAPAYGSQGYGYNQPPVQQPYPGNTTAQTYPQQYPGNTVSNYPNQGL